MKHPGEKPQNSLDMNGTMPGHNVTDIAAASAFGQAHAVKAVNTIIEKAVERYASDIHLEPRQDSVRIRFRIDGILREIKTLPINSYSSVVSRIKIMANMDIAEKRLPQDGRIRICIHEREIDIRVSSLPTVNGEKMVLRLLDKKMRLLKLEELGFSETALEQYRLLINQPHGMIMVTGPAGSGKTTTLYATLNEINSREKNIITIEDPVEYILSDINQMSINTKAGLTFAAALRSVLRQDPDVIMVGEIRDSETAKIAVRAANTGHLVLCTMHTNNSSSALTRLMDMGVEPYLVASSVMGVVAQRLVRKICPHCKEQYNISREDHKGNEKMLFERFFRGSPMVYKGAGCDLCDKSGYRDRLAVTEILRISEGIRQRIVQKVPSHVIYRYACECEGFTPMEQDGSHKIRRGITTIRELAGVIHSQ